MKYSLSDGEVALYDDEGQLIWRGRPLGMPTTKLIELPEGGAIVLLDYMAGPKNFRNILRLTGQGIVVWQASLPEQSGNDAFVDMHRAGDELVANTWSGHLVRIDLETGRTNELRFTK